MRVHTAFALAMVDAAAQDFKQHGVKGSTWMARNVADKVDHQPNAGTRPVKAVHVHCSGKTRERIMQEQGVDVWK